MALVGGALFNWMGVPLPWTLGALAFTIVGAVTHGRTYIPTRLRLLATPIFGVMIGSAFSGDVTGQPGAWLIMVPALLAFLASAIVVGTWYFEHTLQVDRNTAFCAALPGGLSEVILVAPQMQANTQAVVVAQVTRVVVLVFTIPIAFKLFQPQTAELSQALATKASTVAAADYLILALCAIIGSLAGRICRLPLALLSGPMLLSAAVHMGGWTDARLPAWLIALVQVVIGVFAGCRFAGLSLRQLRMALIASTGWTFLLMAVALSVAAIGSRLTGVPLRDLVLALAPGGVQEMTLVALLMGADVAFVSALHLLRISLIAGLVLPLYRGLASGRQPPPGNPDESQSR